MGTMKFDYKTFQLQDLKHYSRNTDLSNNLVLEFRDTWGENIYSVKTTPRCASTLFKNLYCEHYNIEKGGLYNFLHKKRDIDFTKGIRFVPNSIKVVVKRDPIDRWISSINYYKMLYGKRLNSLYHRGRKDENISKHVLNDYYFWKDVDVNDMVKYINRSDSFLRKTAEFVGQYSCNGLIDNYDVVLSLSDIDDFLIVLNEDCDINIDSTPEWTNTSNECVKNVDLITREDLTENSIGVLKSLYRLDYKHGWCEE